MIGDKDRREGKGRFNGEQRMISTEDREQVEKLRYDPNPKKEMSEVF